MLKFKAELDSISEVSGTKFWGVRILNESGKRIGTYNVRLHDMREIGVAKTLNSGNKVVSWLNSPEGQIWLVTRLPKVTYTPIGGFL